MSLFNRKIADFLENQWVIAVEPALNYKNSIKSFLANLKITKVKLVNTVREAQREILTTPVGLFIVEWNLPEINGIQFCRELRRDPNYADKPFLLLTVENMRHDVILASEVGIDGYLLKPFSYEDFIDAIRSLLTSRKSPSRINLYIAEGLKFIDDGDLLSARACFLKGVKENPTSARATCGLAQIATMQKDVSLAVQLYKEAIQFNKDFVDPYRALLELYLTMGNEVSEDLLELALEVSRLSPENPKYTMILAKVYLDLGKIDVSEFYFKKTLRLSPKLAEAFKGLGQVNMAQEDYQSAMKNFRKALDLDAKDVSVLNSLGLAYVKINKFDKGIEKYRAALRMAPHDPRILFNLAYAKEKIEDYNQAIMYYKQALDHDPQFDKARRRLEEVKNKLNQGKVKKKTDQAS